MNIKNFFILKAFISIICGLVLLIIPATAAKVVGVILNLEGSLGAQFIGALLLGIGLICWLSKEGTRDTAGHILLSLLIADIIGFILSLRIQLAGWMNSLGWIVVAVWLILAIGLGFFRFKKS